MNFKNLSEEEFQTMLTQKIDDIINKKSRPADEIVLDDNDLQNFLKISRRTSLDWRQKGFLRYYKMGDGKIYYFLSEVIEDIKNFGKRA